MKYILEKILSFLTHRLFLFTIVILIMMMILLGRLFELQIINGENYEKEFELRVQREISLEGARGNIYDKNGYPLAYNELSFSLSYDSSSYTANLTSELLFLSKILIKNKEYLTIDFPIYWNEFTGYEYIEGISSNKLMRFKKDIFREKLTPEEENLKADQVMDYLSNDFFKFDYSNMTPLERLYVTSLRYSIWAQGSYKYMPEEIAVNISRETLAQIEENLDKISGVRIVEDYQRVYNDPYYFSHIIGYTGSINEDLYEEYKDYGYRRSDTIGRIGIEKSMELYLRGQNGSQLVEVDSLGRSMNILETSEAHSGHDIFLTIDRDLQVATQDILEKQMAHLIQERLLLRKATSGETRRPILKEVYLNLLENNTIKVDEILFEDLAKEKIYQNRIKNQYDKYKGSIIEQLKKSFNNPSTRHNKALGLYYDEILAYLSYNGFLKDDYLKSNAYLDFSNELISIKGLLEFYIKEGFISDEGLSYEKLVEEIILNDFINNTYFSETVFKEMIDKELFSYTYLSMLLVEQGIVNPSEEEISSLKSGRLSGLSFMKSMIGRLELTPKQVGLDPSTGAAIVTDVHTGKVLAMVSYPSYDNNRLVNRFDNDYYQSLLNDKTTPLYPTATQGKTAPGSSFKMLTAIAGLEEGVISPYSRISCTGRFTKIRPNISCWIASYGGAHGSISVDKAIAVSCNSFFNEVGYRLANNNGRYDPIKGDELLRKYCKMFGLGTISGLELPESPPILPGSLNPETNIENTPAAAMGQEQNSYTPSQMARYMSTVANGGTLYKLTLIDQINDYKGNIYEKREPLVESVAEISKETFDIVHKGMGEVTWSNFGTARAFYRDFPIHVGGKTGTAQQIKSRPSHAVFSSFAPLEKPEISVTVVLPFSYTSPFSSAFICGTVAQDIYAQYYMLDQIPKQVEDTSSIIFN